MKKNPFIFYAYPLAWIIVFFLFGYALHDALLPLIAAFFISYLLYPVVLFLERHRVPKKVAVGLVFSTAFSILIGILIILIPQVIHLGIAAFHDFPALSKRALLSFESLTQFVGIPVHIETEAIFQELSNFIENISISSLAAITGLLQKTVFNLIEIGLWVIKFLIFPLFLYYALDRFNSAKEEFISFFPKRYIHHLVEFSQIFNRVLSGYVRGQLVVCSILATFYSISFWYVDLKFGAVIGIITGFAYLVPYVGFASAFIFGIGICLAYFTTVFQLVLIICIFLIGQTLESFILTPRITGNRVGIDPLITILCLIIGGNLFGFVGILTAIPVTGILKEYYTKTKRHYQKSDFYTLN